jgi:lysyl-tRNA synthetase class 2
MSGQEQNINELKKVRLEKLQELRDMGIDPFGGQIRTQRYGSANY